MCGSCEETFNKNDKNVDCSACKKKFHPRCTKISESEIAVLLGKCSLKWYCVFCEPDVEDILNNFEKFKKVSSEISSIKNEIESRFNEIEKKFDQFSTAAPTSSQNQIITQIQQITTADKNEAELREAKKCNLVYFNVPESDSDDAAERMRHDYKLVSEAYDNQVLRHEEINALYRIGKKNSASRPLVVRFQTINNKEKVQKASGQLKIRYRNEIRPIYMSIDRTPSQREQHKKLVEELKSRKSNGESNIVIRIEKIVPNFPRQNEGQRTTWASLFRH